ncbi:MAG: T9SS type A sorting domain-containing protein [Saprospiraceae bacterium]|nr:T9SS type A sorting domain-containing protein [Saprospiraceae bacterium]
MMKMFTRSFAFILFIAIGAVQSFGQVPFFTEDFSAGIPAGWTNVDATSAPNQLVVFQAATDPAAVAPAALGYQPSSVFNAPTAAMGYIWANSDRGLPGAPAEDHTTRLTTTPIDCSDRDLVFLRFQSLIGVFDYDASTNAIVRVSTDGGTTWTDFTAFPCLVTGAANPPCVRWSANPEVVVVNISSAAANEANVLIQWQWNGGWEYFWALDDVELIDSDPRLPNNMRINNFFAFAPNAQTPASQVEPFGFLADIENVGTAAQMGAVLTVTIENSNEEEIFSTSIMYGEIASDSTAENVLFPTEFVMPAIPDLYFGTYTLTLSPEEDQDTSNNTREFAFAVTQFTFAKELEATRSVAPAADDSYTYGNVYYVPNGQGYLADALSFRVANADELAGRSVTTLLYKWDGDANDNLRADPAEFGGGPIAFNSYTFVGDEGTNFITLPVDLDGNEIALEDDSYYIVVVQYTTDDDQPMFLLANGVNDYQATWFRSDSLGAPRYAGALDVGNTGSFGLVGFGFSIVPVVRFHIADPSSAQEPVLPATAINVYPNPANEQFTVALNLDAPSSKVEVSIMDISGKVLRVENHQNLFREQLSYNVANLPSGAYNVRVRTDKGIVVKRVVIQH